MNILSLFGQGNKELDEEERYLEHKMAVERVRKAKAEKYKIEKKEKKSKQIITKVPVRSPGQKRDIMYNPCFCRGRCTVKNRRMKF